MAAKIGKEAYLLSKNRPGTPTVNKARLTKRILPEMSVTNWQIGNMIPKRSVLFGYSGQLLPQLATPGYPMHSAKKNVKSRLQLQSLKQNKL